MAIENSLQSTPVTVLKTGSPLALDAETPIRDSIRRMVEVGASVLLLTTGDRLTGIFTERDFVQRVLGRTELLDLPMSSVMTREPVRAALSDALRIVIMRMHQGRFRHIPLTDSAQRVAGCIRHEDVGKYLVQHYRDRVLNLPPDPEQVARNPEGG